MDRKQLEELKEKYLKKVDIIYFNCATMCRTLEAVQCHNDPKFLKEVKFLRDPQWYHLHEQTERFLKTIDEHHLLLDMYHLTKEEEFLAQTRKLIQFRERTHEKVNYICNLYNIEIFYKFIQFANLNYKYKSMDNIGEIIDIFLKEYKNKEYTFEFGKLEEDNLIWMHYTINYYDLYKDTFFEKLKATTC